MDFSSVADPGGGGGESAATPPFFRPIFVIFGRGIEEFGFPAPPPPFFTDPGSVSAPHHLTTGNLK